MKLRDFKKGGGSAWPPDVGGSYGRGDTFPTGGEAILTGVRLNTEPQAGLFIDVEYEGRELVGAFLWDNPSAPSPEKVAEKLRQHIGKRLDSLSELEV